MNTHRRGIMRAAAGAALCGASAVVADEPGPIARNGRIKHSICRWCFQDAWKFPELIAVARQLGCGSVELLGPRDFPALKAAGLTCAMASIDMGGVPGFVRGWNNPKYRAQVLQATRKVIDACSEFRFKNVIAFTGMREDIPDDVGASNCVEGFKQIVGHAESKKVTICLEMLNSRVGNHPMKGHPGYQGDHTDYCIDIIKCVGSPNLKLLFDIYHVQIMDGDVISRIRQHKEYLGHVHTAGNPGRGELDAHQEIQYRAVMEALVDVGYQGFVGQEFIPTRDPLTGLKEAIATCDV